MRSSLRTSRFVRPVLAALLLAAANVYVVGGQSAKAGTLPANKWTVLSDKGPVSVYGRMTWLPGSKRALVWPNWHPRAGKGSPEKTAQLHFFDPAKNAWAIKASTMRKDGQPAHGAVASPYVYMPGLKKVLFLAPHWVYGGKFRANSWLLDPSGGKWEGLGVNLQMGSTPKECGVPLALYSYQVPAWGALCYDAHNGEAVSLGGGGIYGRIDVGKEKVKVGDWIFDEKLKRVRRLMAADKGKVTEARRFYPGHCGAWTFSEKTGKWAPVAQPMSQQPSGRVLPGMAYDPEAKKIVAFGGDDLTRCLADTWIYDCTTKKWSQAAPKNSPPARAGQAMLYVPGAKVVLMAGGYGTGWRPRTDTWVYEVAGNKWTQLDISLPTPAFYAAAVYVPESKTVLLRSTPKRKGWTMTPTLCALKLELGSAGRLGVAKTKTLKYHCLDKTERQPTPEEWESPANRGVDPAARRRSLAALPANTWVMQKTPLETASRTWGFYVYDIRTHKAYAWGGGHGGYQGADMSEYDLLRNRWSGMVDPPDFKHPWRHKNSGDSPPGLTYNGCVLIQSHGRKSHGVDPLSNTVITSHGDVYSIAERRFMSSIGRCPGRWNLGDQVGYLTTPHGLYGYNSRGGVYRANVAGGKWDQVGGNGPRHSEHNPMTYDSKRDRIFYLNMRDATVWSFDFKTKKWGEEKRVGKAPRPIGGDPAYIPELDAMLFVFSTSKHKVVMTNYVYKIAERKWYTAEYKGDVGTRTAGGNGWLCNSTFWDPKHKILMRVCGHFRQAHVLLMRPDFKTLKLTPLK